MVNMGTAIPDGISSRSPMVTADRHRAARFHQSTAKVIIKTEIRVHSAVFFTIGGIAGIVVFAGTMYLPAVSHVAVVAQEYQKDTLQFSNDGSQLSNDGSQQAKGRRGPSQDGSL